MPVKTNTGIKGAARMSEAIDVLSKELPVAMLKAIYLLDEDPTCVDVKRHAGWWDVSKKARELCERYQILVVVSREKSRFSDLMERQTCLKGGDDMPCKKKKKKKK